MRALMCACDRLLNTLLELGNASGAKQILAEAKFDCQLEREPEGESEASYVEVWAGRGSKYRRT